MGQNIHYKEKSIHVHKKQLQFHKLKVQYMCLYKKRLNQFNYIDWTKKQRAKPRIVSIIAHKNTNGQEDG